MQKFLKFASFTSKCVTFISETLQLTFTSLVVYLYCLTCNIQKILEKLLLLLRSVSLIFKEKVAIFVGLCQLSTGLGDVGVVLRRLYFVVEERLLKKYFFAVFPVAALLWIKDNIGGFGGDPGRVTLSGHGTGAALVNLLMISPLASSKPLFFYLRLSPSLPSLF